MAETTEQIKPNQSFLGSSAFEDEALETMIEVDQVSMVFNMASQQLHSLKEYTISFARRELRFKEFRALDDVSLTVKRGDVFGIMGTNGSGKSTLLKIIAGVLDPTEGNCTINGTIAPLIELGAGFDIELTARENIYLNGALLGYSKEFINEHFDEIVNFAEIRPFLDMPLKNYSSGMVARIAFAIATVIIPDILIVDEVLSVGDFMFQQKCERRIQSLIRDYGVTVLIVSHNSDQIERLCNKAIWIEKGHTRMIGTASEVCQLYRILGGRVGSEESERIILDLFEQTSESQSAKSPLQRISANTRYELSAQLYAHDRANRDAVVLAYGTDFVTTILSAGLAGVEGADILNVSEESLSGALEQMLKEQNYARMILVQAEERASQGLKERLGMLLPNASVEEIVGEKPSWLSRALFNLAKEDGHTWAQTALLCAPHNKADLVSISSFVFTHNIPIFFIDETGLIPAELASEINTFDSLILLGGSISFPESSLTNIDSHVKIKRLYGNGPYDAYLKIQAWIHEQDEQPSRDEGGYFIASFADVERIAQAGLFAQRNSGSLHLYDDQDADSVAAIIKEIQGGRVSLDHLFIIGIASSLSDASITLFSQAATSRKDHQ